LDLRHFILENIDAFWDYRDILKVKKNVDWTGYTKLDRFIKII